MGRPSDAAVGAPFYAYAAIAYLRRRTGLALAVAFAFSLAEALVVAVASLQTSWRLSWWEWHVLMAVSFTAIGTAAWSEWYEERFSALYLDETLAGHRDVTVRFADLAGSRRSRRPAVPSRCTRCSSPTSASSRR